MLAKARGGFVPALFIILIVVTAVPALSAIGDHVWSSGYPAAGSVDTDAAGNVVMHGSFFSPLDLGGGVMNPANFLAGDLFLGRFDPHGNHLWSQQITPNGFGATYLLVASSPSGDIYLTGRTAFGTSDVDFGGGPVPANTLYIAKLSSGGIHQWTRSIGDGWPKGIDADAAGVVVTGYTSTGIDFGGGTIGTAGANDVFVASLSSGSGAHVWSAGFGDTEAQGGMDVAVDGSGNVIVAGSMFGTVDFGGGPLVANALDLFLASFSSTGSHNWSRVFDGTFTPGGGILVNCSVATGPSGEIAAAGEMRDVVNLGGSDLTSNGFSDAWIAKFDGAGVHQWSAVHGVADGSDNADDVAIDGSGNVLVAGGMVGGIDFGGGSVTYTGDPLSGDRNLFVALYDPVGAHLFSAGYGQRTWTGGCRIGAGNDLIVFGTGSSPIDFGGGPISVTDQFLARLTGNGGGGGISTVGDTPRFSASLRAAPNPFNPMTNIRYETASPGPATLLVYDLRGRLVEALVPERWHEAGPHQVAFTPTATGMYLVRLKTRFEEKTLKLMAIK